ncbi:MAG: TonB-dependent receptor [Fibrobacteres bacterium]|nr:TonB-dependent receptor [Fibrobacterota bacterium]
MVTQNDEAWISDNSVSGECEWSVPPLSVSDLKLQIKGKFNRIEIYYPQRIISYATARIIHRIDDELSVDGALLTSNTVKDAVEISTVVSGGYEAFIPFDKKADVSLSKEASRVNGAAGVTFKGGKNSLKPYLTVRYDGTIFKTDSMSTDEFSDTYSQDKRDVLHVFSGSAGLTFNPVLNTSAGINISRRKQLPSFYQLFGDRGLSLGNPSLKPEDARIAELFFRSFINHGWLSMNFEAACFYNYTIDAIVSYTYMTGGQLRWINADGFSNLGFEINFAQNLGNRFHVSLSGTLQNPIIHSKNYYSEAYDGKRMPGESKYTAIPKLAVDLTKNVEVWYSVKFQGDYFSDQYNDRTFHYFPASNLHNAGITFKLLKNFEFYSRFENLTNIQNFDAYGHPVPGRMIFAGVQIKGSENKQ